eukprot:763930-Hanusia_phi.AAC.11
MLARAEVAIDQHYISRNPGPNPNKNIILAGHATHNESGFLQEVIVRKLMEGSKHLIVDGSLSNAEWYREYLMQIRTKLETHCDE